MKVDRMAFGILVHKNIIEWEYQSTDHISITVNHAGSSC